MLVLSLRKNKMYPRKLFHHIAFSNIFLFTNNKRIVMFSAKPHEVEKQIS